MDTNAPDPIIIALLDRYLAGEATPAEQLQVERWLGQSEANSQLLAGLRAASPGGMGIGREFNISAEWTTLAAGLGLPGEAPADRTPNTRSMGRVPLSSPVSRSPSLNRL